MILIQLHIQLSDSSIHYNSKYCSLPSNQTDKPAIIQLKLLVGGSVTGMAQVRKLGGEGWGWKGGWVGVEDGLLKYFWLIIKLYILRNVRWISLWFFKILWWNDYIWNGRGGVGLSYELKNLAKSSDLNGYN